MSTMQYIAWGWKAARMEARRRRSLRSGTRTQPAAVSAVLGAVVEHGLAVAGLACFMLELRMGE